MMWEYLKLSIAIVGTVIADRWVWHKLHDVYPMVYVSVLIVWVVLKTCGWPKAAWLDKGMSNLASTYSSKRPGNVKAGMQVDTIGNIEDIRLYCAARYSLYQADQLCEMITEGFTSKIVIYAACTIFYLFLSVAVHPASDVRAGDRVQEVETFLKSAASLLIALGPLVWEYAKWELQVTWARRISAYRSWSQKTKK